MASSSDEEDLPKIIFLSTLLFQNLWSKPLFYKGRPIENNVRVGKVQEAFIKRRPYQSKFLIYLFYGSALSNQLLAASQEIINGSFYPIRQRPYIILIKSRFEHQSKIEKILKTLAQNQGIIPLSFPSIQRFNNALCLLPHSNSLIQFHFQLCEALTQEGIEIREIYRPGVWEPGCIVARKAAETTMEEDLLEIQKFTLPYNGHGVGIKLVEAKTGPDVYLFEKEGAVLLFRKVITLADELLCRFSVPKEIAENEMYFPPLAQRESIDIQVWEDDGRILDTVMKRYMNYTYHISADWKVPRERMRLVAGDVMDFYLLQRPNIFIFPYQYMMLLNQDNGDVEDNVFADLQE